jgi:hypothetical protein
MLSSIKEFLKWKIFKILAEQFLLFNFAFAQRRRYEFGQHLLVY